MWQFQWQVVSILPNQGPSGTRIAQASSSERMFVGQGKRHFEMRKRYHNYFNGSRIMQVWVFSISWSQKNRDSDSIKLLQWGDSWRRLYYTGWCAFDGARKGSLVLIHGFQQWSSSPQKRSSTPFRCANAAFVQELHVAREGKNSFSWC